MGAHEVVEPRSAGTRIETALSWLGGGRPYDPHGRAGVVVVLTATLAWLVAGLAVIQTVHWPIAAVLAVTLLFALLVGTLTRAIASGPTRNGRAMLGRVAVGTAIGVVVGELAALAVFAGSIDHRLDERAALHADSALAVAAAAADLQRVRTARTALDENVDAARTRRDDALVVARCEFHPSPTCPQTRITGVPGAGPETRTAKEILAATQQQLDTAVASREQQAPALDAQIDSGTAQLAQVRQSAITTADRGLGARWAAMNDLTRTSPSALAARLAAVGFFILMALLPLLLRRWRGETTDERKETARDDLDRAETQADVAIAVKRAEVRTAVETMWAEHELTRARLAIEAQEEIERAEQRRRVAAALAAAPPAPTEAIDAEMYLPIAAAAEAASRTVPELPAAAEPAGLPAVVEPEPEPAPPAPARSIPTLPDVTRAAMRWTRPLVPTFVARAIDTTAHPLRTARQVFEDVEEITFALRRTRKVTVDTEESTTAQPAQPGPQTAGAVTGHNAPAAVQPGDPWQLAGAMAELTGPAALRGSDELAELTGSSGPAELGAPQGPRQLPPAG